MSSNYPKARAIILSFSPAILILIIALIDISSRYDPSLSSGARLGLIGGWTGGVIGGLGGSIGIFFGVRSELLNTAGNRVPIISPKWGNKEWIAAILAINGIIMLLVIPMLISFGPSSYQRNFILERLNWMAWMATWFGGWVVLGNYRKRTEEKIKELEAKISEFRREE